MIATGVERHLSRRSFLEGLGAIGLASAFGNAGANEPTRRQFRILSYNIHHGRGTDDRVDLPRIAEIIRSAEPDLVALQEVDNRTRRTGGVDQTSELARLTGLHGRFGKAFDYQGGEYGQAILSRAPFESITVHGLPGTAESEHRIAVEARLKIAGLTVTFIGTHLHHRDGRLREQQAQKLNELFASGDRLAILAGDLNATPDSAPMQVLSRTWSIGIGESPLLTFPSSAPTRQIDYVLARPKPVVRFVEGRVLDEPIASDHRPLLAALALTNDS